MKQINRDFYLNQLINSYLVVEIDMKNNPTNELKRFYFINVAIGLTKCYNVS
jgi:hypothetical protein